MPIVNIVAKQNTKKMTKDKKYLDALEIVEKYHEQLNLQDVSYQRELLESFAEWYNYRMSNHEQILTGYIEDYLEDSNCS